MSALYNEVEPFAVQWMRNLIAAGHVAPGVVDGRSIKELSPADVAGPGQRHFFAGIAVWSLALRMAGYPDDASVWSGSCPCQPFSSAGQRRGIDDERHLWPEWFRLIRECRPAVVVGEQVASPDGLAWLDAVRADMEGAGYSFAAFDLCAAGVGAPHIRQRLYFAAVRLGYAHGEHAGRDGRAASRAEAARSCGGELDGRHGDQPGASGRARAARAWRIYFDRDGLADADGDGRGQAVLRSGGRASQDAAPKTVNRSSDGGGADSAWRDVEWLDCRDGKRRPTQPGLFPLAHGATSRVGRLRAYGNAIVAPLAATFLEALKPSVEHLLGGAR